MSQAGEFSLCSGCGQWAIWTPRHRKGPIYCCEGCARDLGCTCGKAPDEWVPAAASRRGARGGSRIPHQRLEAIPTATLCVPCQEQREAARAA
ncbi:MAG: TraR/DksA C4-type zinc finger protein [candidate division NC10 bacterium]|nr:TraR/DksA C4-type zinc finger protein [candidate division NC10 bacterium]